MGAVLVGGRGAVLEGGMGGAVLEGGRGAVLVELFPALQISAQLPAANLKKSQVEISRVGCENGRVSQDLQRNV
jgi:hypothetical protein